MTTLDDTRYCPMCDDSAKKILELEQRVRLGDSMRDARIAFLEQRVKVLTDAAQGLMAWQVKNVHVWRNSAYDYMQEVIDQTPQQTAAQIERWHVEWMMKLSVMAYGDRLGTHLQQAYCVPDTGVPPWMAGMTKLVAIPPLPKESDSPETDLDESLRRQ